MVSSQSLLTRTLVGLVLDIVRHDDQYRDHRIDHERDCVHEIQLLFYEANVTNFGV